MKKKIFNGVEFTVYKGGKIEGDFIHPNEAVYFENSVEITGRLEVKYLKCEGFIYVHKSYIVEKWEEVAEYQKVGWYQEVGGSQKVERYQLIKGSQEIGGSQKIGRFQVLGSFQEVGGYQEVGGSQKVGGYQKVRWNQKVGSSQEVGSYQKVGSSQKVGWYQEIGGSQKIGSFQVLGSFQEVGGSQDVLGFQEVGRSQEVKGDLSAKSSRVALQSTVGGSYDVTGKVFVGVCGWKDTTREEETLTCGKFISGDIKYGYLVETGIKGDDDNKMVKAMQLLTDNGYKVIRE